MMMAAWQHDGYPHQCCRWALPLHFVLGFAGYLVRLSSSALCRGSMNGRNKLNWVDPRDMPEDDMSGCAGFTPFSLSRSRQQTFGCAPRGRTSCGGRSALPQHFVLGFAGYLVRLSSPALCRGSMDGRSKLNRG